MQFNIAGQADIQFVIQLLANHRQHLTLPTSLTLHFESENDCHNFGLELESAKIKKNEALIIQALEGKGSTCVNQTFCQEFYNEKIVFPMKLTYLDYNLMIKFLKKQINEICNKRQVCLIPRDKYLQLSGFNQVQIRRVESQLMELKGNYQYRECRRTIGQLQSLMIKSKYMKETLKNRDVMFCEFQKKLFLYSKKKSIHHSNLQQIEDQIFSQYYKKRQYFHGRARKSEKAFLQLKQKLLQNITSRIQAAYDMRKLQVSLQRNQSKQQTQLCLQVLCVSKIQDTADQVFFKINQAISKWFIFTIEFSNENSDQFKTLCLFLKNLQRSTQQIKYSFFQKDNKNYLAVAVQLDISQVRLPIYANFILQRIALNDTGSEPSFIIHRRQFSGMKEMMSEFEKQFNFSLKKDRLSITFFQPGKVAFKFLQFFRCYQQRWKKAVLEQISKNQILHQVEQHSELSPEMILSKNDTVVISQVSQQQSSVVQELNTEAIIQIQFGQTQPLATNKLSKIIKLPDVFLDNVQFNQRQQQLFCRGQRCIPQLTKKIKQQFILNGIKKLYFVNNQNWVDHRNMHLFYVIQDIYKQQTVRLLKKAPMQENKFFMVLKSNEKQDSFTKDLVVAFEVEYKAGTNM